LAILNRIEVRFDSIRFRFRIADSKSDSPIRYLRPLEKYAQQVIDWRVGPDPESDQTPLWDALFDLIVQYRGMDRNSYHMEIMKSFQVHQGYVSIITGVVGTGKTTLVADNIVLMTLVGHKVWVVSELQDAVDNIANMFWDSYNLTLEKTKLEVGTPNRPRNTQEEDVSSLRALSSS
jgi:hypothetical protein